VVPLTSGTSRVYRSEALVTVGGRQSKAVTDQITTAGKTWLKSRLGALSRPEMKAVEEAIKIHLALPL
jgi:mRNA interferase MazF